MVNGRRSYHWCPFGCGKSVYYVQRRITTSNKTYYKFFYCVRCYSVFESKKEMVFYNNEKKESKKIHILEMQGTGL